jgi:heme exporter protein C
MKNISSSGRLLILDLFSGAAVVAALGLVFFYAPYEESMGAVQKVFYFHVSMGWVGMLGFLAAALCAGIYLWRVNRDGAEGWDIASLAGVEIGLVFMALCIASGSIWARPIWNTWWTWDPRLTTAAIMELIYAAYLLLRQGIEDPSRQARFAAVYALVGFISVPLTFISIRIFRTIHPVLIGSNDPSAQPMNMTSAMGITFAVSLAAFSLVFIDLYWRRIRLANLARQVERLEVEAAERMN